MKRRAQGQETGSKAAGVRKAVEHKAGKSAKQDSRGDLERVLSLIRTRPGIRPSEINRLLHRAQSDGLRSTLIKRGLVRKEKDGATMRYYPV